jgi:hypothetical protein
MVIMRIPRTLEEILVISLNYENIGPIDNLAYSWNFLNIFFHAMGARTIQSPSFGAEKYEGYSSH